MVGRGVHVVRDGWDLCSWFIMSLARLIHELGQRCVPVAVPPTLAKALGASLDELIGEPVGAAKKRGPAPKPQQHMERISQLPKPRQRMVMEMLELALAHQGRQ